MDKKTIFEADVQLLSKDLAALMRDEERRKHYLDLACGELRLCSCLLNAASTAFGGEGSDAHVALREASPSAASALLSFAYGDEVKFNDEDELATLLPLARKIGVEACVTACRTAIGKAGSMEFPVTLKMEDADARKQREMLGKLYGEGRFVDFTLSAVSPQGSRTKADTPVHFRVHRAVLAAASGYFSAVWAHGFADSSAPDIIMTEEIDADIVRLLVKGLYGEKVEADFNQLVDLFALADKWQILAISIPVLNQIRQILTPELAKNLLLAPRHYPEQIFLAALIKAGEASTIIVAGLPGSQVTRNGTYKKVCSTGPSKTNGWRPLYKSDRDQYLFYWPKKKSWNIGPDPIKDSWGVRGKSSKTPQPLHCPTHASSWDVFDGTAWHAVSSVTVSSPEECQFLSEMLSTNVGISVRILTGVGGLPKHIEQAAAAWVAEHTTQMVTSEVWLALGTDQMTQIRHLMDLYGRDNDVLKDGIVQWSRAGVSECREALEKLRGFCSSSSRIHGETKTSEMLHDLGSRLLNSYGEDALSIIEEIFISDQDHDKASNTEHIMGEGESNNKHPSARKRCLETSDGLQDSMVDAAAQWASSRIKRLRTLKSWPLVRSEAFGAVLRARSDVDFGCGEDELTKATLEWTSSATPKSVLNAIRHCIGAQIDRKVLDALVDSVADKVATLEGHCQSLGGDGLLAALEAQRKAESEAVAAKADAEEQRRIAAALRAKAEQACDERQRMNMSMKQFADDLEAKAKAMRSCITNTQADEQVVKVEHVS